MQMTSPFELYDVSHPKDCKIIDKTLELLNFFWGDNLDSKVFFYLSKAKYAQSKDLCIEHSPSTSGKGKFTASLQLGLEFPKTDKTG